MRSFFIWSKRSSSVSRSCKRRTAESSHASLRTERSVSSRNGAIWGSVRSSPRKFTVIAPIDLLVLLLELGELRLAGDIGLSKQGAAILEGPVEDRIAGPGQLRPFRRVEITVPDLVLQRLQLGLDLANERQVGGFSFRVVGLAGHRDVTLGPLFTNGRIQLTGRGQPLLELGSRSGPADPGASGTTGSICSQVLSSTPSGSQLVGVSLRLVTTQFDVSLRSARAHGSVAWTSQAPANSHDCHHGGGDDHDQGRGRNGLDVGKKPLGFSDPADGLKQCQYGRRAE